MVAERKLFIIEQYWVSGQLRPLILVTPGEKSGTAAKTESYLPRFC